MIPEKGKVYQWDGSDEVSDDDDDEPSKVRILNVPVIEVERVCPTCGARGEGSIYVRISSLTEAE